MLGLNCYYNDQWLEYTAAPHLHRQTGERTEHKNKSL